MEPETAEKPFVLATALGPVPESARALAMSLDPADAAAFVAARCLEIVYADRVDDPLFVEAINRSAHDNIDALLRILAGRAPMEQTMPLGAYAFAETAAEVGVPVSQFERVYRVGTSLVWLFWYRAAKAHAEATGVPLTELIEAPSLVIHTYFDVALTPTLARYDATRAETRRTRDQLQRTVLRQALERPADIDVDEAAQALGVDPDGGMIAFVVHGDRLDFVNVVEPAKTASGASTALTYQHGPDSWIVWLWRRSPFGPEDHQRLLRALAGTGLTIALGDAQTSVAGLGRTGADALEAARLQAMLGDEPGVLSYTDVRLESLLLRSPAEARRFVADELGALDEDTARGRKLRETAMLWLSTGSHVATAATLQLHEHTVRNRIAQAEELLGSALALRRTELLVALRLLRLLENVPGDAR